jgi:hypothetical protein
MRNVSCVECKVDDRPRGGDEQEDTILRLALKKEGPSCAIFYKGTSSTMITDLIHMNRPKTSMIKCRPTIYNLFHENTPSTRPATLRRHGSHLPNHRHAQPPLLGLERQVILSEQVRELDKGAFGRHVVARYHADLVENDAGDVLPEELFGETRSAGCIAAPRSSLANLQSGRTLPRAH